MHGIRQDSLSFTVFAGKWSVIGFYRIARLSERREGTDITHFDNL